MPKGKISLRMWRRIHDRSNRETAAWLGISPGELSKVENGARVADPGLVARIAKMTAGRVSARSLVDAEHARKLEERRRERMLRPEFIAPEG